MTNLILVTILDVFGHHFVVFGHHFGHHFCQIWSAKLIFGHHFRFARFFGDPSVSNFGDQELFLGDQIWIW